jgi:class 3 adenylate cyclase/tetratricopeptide (TPR) repeat protein
MSGDAASLLEEFIPAPLRARSHTLIEWPAAALLIDISGFSSLTCRLALRGAAGIEQLTEQLRAAFGHILDVVEELGGAPLQFMGDGLLVHFPASHSSEQRARATAAADRILAKDPTPGADVTLRAGVGFGTIAVELIEIPDEREEPRVLPVFSGSAIDAASRAAARATAGQTVVENASATLSWNAQPKARRATAGLPRFAPSLVKRRLSAGLGLPEPEFRHVTAAFVRLDAARSDHLRLKVDAAAIERVTTARGGYFHQLASDDKGLYAMILFGLPGYSAEDDADAAVLTLLELKRTLGRESRLAAGIASGLCYVGVDGDRRLRDLAIVGPAVNRAAALMVRCPEGIWCAEETQKRARSVELEQTTEILLKGEDSPSVAFTPRSIRSVPTRRDRGLLGRERTLHELAELLQRSRLSGQERVLLLVGDAGVGKSALLVSAAEHLEHAGRSWIWCSGRAFEMSTPLSPWLTVLTRDVSVPSGASELLTRLGDLAVYAALLNEGLGTRFASTSQLELLGAEGRSEMLRALVARLFTTRPSSARWILVDDLQLFDPESARLLGQLIVEHGYEVLATLRCGSTAAGDVSQLLPNELVRRIEVSSLDARASGQLACALLGVSALDKQLAEFLAARAEGNPLFIQELCLAMKQQRLLTVEDDTACLGSSSDAELIPLTLQGLMTARVDRLEARTRELVKLASVLGDPFRASTLEAMARDKLGDGTKDRLAELVAAGLLSEKGEELSFSHALLRAAVYEALPPTPRRLLHAKVAAHLADEPGLSALAREAQLAFHLERAELHDAAMKHAARAGDLACDRSAHAETIEFYTVALRNHATLGPTSPAGSEQTIGWALRIGLAQVAQRNYLAALQPLDQALTQLGFPVPRSRGATIAGVLSELSSWALRSLGGRRYRRRADTPWRLQAACDALEAMGEVYFFSAAPELCFLSVIRQLRLSESLGPGTHFVRACANAGITAGLIPMHGLAAQYFDRAVSALQHGADVRSQGHLYLVRGMYWAGRGHFRPAVDDFARVLAVSRPSGDLRLELDAISNLAYVAYFNGYYAVALELAERLLAVGRRDPRYADEGHRLQLYCACQEERLALAKEAACELEEMLSRRDTSDAISTRTDLLAHQTWIRAHSGDVPGALDAAARALSLRERNSSGLGYYTDVVAIDATFRGLHALRGPSLQQRAEAIRLQSRASRLLHKLAKTYGFAKSLAERSSAVLAEVRSERPRLAGHASRLEGGAGCSEAYLRSVVLDEASRIRAGFSP